MEREIDAPEGAVHLKQRRRSLIGVCLALMVVWILLAIWWDSQRGWTVSRLERLVRAEVASDFKRADVEEWFDRHHIQHSYYSKTTGELYGQSTMPMLAGLRGEDIG